MDKQEIHDRITHLRTAIAWSRYTGKHMSIGQGIMCHQEIASLYALLDQRDSIRIYRISPQIEEKVNQINHLVEVQNWKNPNELI